MATEVMMIGILTVINVIMFLVTGAIGIFSFIELRSFMKSTHKVEFIPLDPNMGESSKNQGYDPLKEYGVN